ncbi:hypothetical protein SLEP1_g20918 [Rubroshorea leprosula]|uniref:Uncharacterized protein n=1 Tax=Rubroshorea leprosula TaxID=152421 RepID=A0AAV5JBQ3_9ROSI|nr:hypothetical protein SLEP1_g20918 [Rubroshorea leprosula]
MEDHNYAIYSSSSSNLLKGEEDFIRHSLEASDDENARWDFDKLVGVVKLVGCGAEDLNGSGDGLPTWSDGLWELENEVAN